jgi:hypothetical protein
VDTGGASHIIAFGPNPAPNVLHQLVVTYDGDTGFAGVYLDGAVMTTKYMGNFIPQTTYDLNIGHRPCPADAGNRLFNGSIYDVKIYNYARTAGQILTSYNEMPK